MEKKLIIVVVLTFIIIAGTIILPKYLSRVDTMEYIIHSLKVNDYELDKSKMYIFNKKANTLVIKNILGRT